MKVYVVSMGNYYSEDWYVEAIFDSKQKAINYLIKLKWVHPDPDDDSWWTGGYNEDGRSYKQATIFADTIR